MLSLSSLSRPSSRVLLSAQLGLPPPLRSLSRPPIFSFSSSSSLSLSPSSTSSSQSASQPSSTMPPSSSSPLHTSPDRPLHLSLAAGFTAKNVPFDPAISVVALNRDPSVPISVSSAEYKSPRPAEAPRSRSPNFRLRLRPAEGGPPKWLAGQDAFFASTIGAETMRLPGGGGGSDTSSSNTKPDGKDTTAAGASTLPSAIAFGVVDGVGGWIENGIDPAHFAQALCANLASVSASHKRPGPGSDNSSSGPSPATPPSPTALLADAFQAVLRDRAILGGGSTACLAVFDPATRSVEAANLGDSGFVHISPHAVKYASPAQTHGFNTPFQLTKMPAAMRRQMKLFGAKKGAGEQDPSAASASSSSSGEEDDIEGWAAERPRDADVTSHKVRPGDVLVFATDGVWDNVFPEEALKVVCAEMGSIWDKLASSSSSSSSSPGPLSSPPPLSSPSSSSSLSSAASLSSLSSQSSQSSQSSISSSCSTSSAPAPAPAPTPASVQPPASAPASASALEPSATSTAATRIATRLTALAKSSSHDVKRDGPFAKAAQQMERDRRRRMMAQVSALRRRMGFVDSSSPSSSSPTSTDRSGGQDKDKDKDKARATATTTSGAEDEWARFREMKDEQVVDEVLGQYADAIWAGGKIDDICVVVGVVG